MRPYFIFLLRHRDDPSKFTLGDVSGTWGAHATAMGKYRGSESSKYDRVIDLGCASVNKEFGIRPPKHASHTQHRPKSAGHQNKS